jgi:hypothetical protein
MRAIAIKLNVDPASTKKMKDQDALLYAGFT